MAGRVAEFEVLGPWSLETSRRFWEGFTPAALAGEPARPGLRTVFCAEGDWRRAEAEVTEGGDTAHVVLTGGGDLDAAAAQACRFLALDIDGRGRPQVGRRDPGRREGRALGRGRDLEVVGESFYQDNLRRLAGARPGEPVRAEITAVLAAEDDNPCDRKCDSGLGRVRLSPTRPWIS